MKIKPEHIEYMRGVIAAGVAIPSRAHRPLPKLADYLAAGMSAKRWRWDVLYYVGLSSWLVEHVYPYANDEHIDTALRHITDTK